MGRTAHSRCIPRPTERGMPRHPVLADTPGEMDSAAKRRLGDIVVERNMVTPHQLEQALEQQRVNGGKLGETLVELGFITRVELAGAISEQWDDLRRRRGGESTEPKPRAASPVTPGSGEPSANEAALRQRLEALTVEARRTRPAHRPAGRDDHRAPLARDRVREPRGLTALRRRR